MFSRRVVRLVCGGGSAVVFCAAAAAVTHDFAGERKGAVPLLHAASPVWSGNGSVQSSGHGWDSNWDKREPASMLNPNKKKNDADGDLDSNNNSSSNKPRATRHIFLIRHSQYVLNGNGDREKILTPLGREQAELVGQRLAHLGLKYDVLIHSSMSRAKETANIISKHLPGVDLVSCDLLREGAPIEPVPNVTHWKPEAVQYHEDGARIEAAFRRYIHRADPSQKEDSYEIIVCHANVIRYFVCRALQFPPEGWLRLGLNNGSITWLTIRPSGRVALRALGDSGFMPPDKITRT